MPDDKNPLVSDRDVDFVLYQVLDAPSLWRVGGSTRGPGSDDLRYGN